MFLISFVNVYSMFHRVEVSTITVKFQTVVLESEDQSINDLAEIVTV